MEDIFAQNYSLSVSISITFEQNYSGIDGDSASSTEVYGVLSSLSGIPIHQGIAVTGSVNQKGEIQAVETGAFHIYAAFIGQGIEVLTDTLAGEMDSKLNYSENIVFGLVQKKLGKYHERSREFRK